ncbi:MAG: NADH:ubiquinone reductase (Na(+)-transporting) subunit F [Bacteroidales bacterium]|nr:NADH:ubiquinone reductase (Na(+)-transporting) subunit F [Bacteroidales bacterium]
MSTTFFLLVSAAVFLIIILILVVLLLVAKNKLVASGNVNLLVNDERNMSVPMGGTLLNALQNQGIFLSSACGGKGSCGQCRCQVLEGGGAPIATELPHFSRKELQNNWRLSCQVKVKQDMKVHVPDEVFGVKEWECEVISNHNVASFIKEFTVKLPEGERMDFKAGSYAQITIPKYEIPYTSFDVDDKFKKEWDKFNMWSLVAKNDEETTRAYSMANYPAEGNIITLNVRIATPPFDRKNGGWMKVPPGIASSYIFNLKPGDKVKMSGPYGDFHIHETDSEMVYIGGGAGMAPLRAQLLHLFNTVKTGRKVSYWYGARSRAEIFYEEDFREIERKFPNFTFNIALSAALPEDNWTGLTGFIHQALYDNYLKDHPAPEDIEYYMCGPGPMTQSALRMLDDLGVSPDNIYFDNFG